MAECWECGEHEPEGALYCRECGALLLETEERATGTRHPFTDALSPPPAPTLVGQEANPATKAQKITFVIPSSGRQMEMKLEQDIRIGRADPRADHYPELDFTTDEGDAHGVSRLHALIQPSSEGVVVVDNSSTNGTLLNGYRLPPDLPYPIQNGDELRFGRLLVHVFFE